MVHNAIQDLKELKLLLSALTDRHYNFKSETLSGATIGQHIRHILEFYGCLNAGLSTGIINYDSRQRNLDLETRTRAAIEETDRIVENLWAAHEDRQLILEGNFGFEEGETSFITSSLYRELVYNLEHSIHHQALIKAGLQELKLTHLAGPGFGIAPATFRFNQRKAVAVNS